MRRVIRHLTTALSVLCFLLCISAAAMWARSYLVSDSFPRVVEANQLQFHSAHGRLIVVGTREAKPKPGQVFDPKLTIGERKVRLAGIDKALHDQLIEERGSLKLRQVAIRTNAAELGNAFGFDVTFWALGPWYVVIPYWFVVALLSLPPVVSGVSALRRRRRRGSKPCPRCSQPVRLGEDRCASCGAPVTV